MTPISNTICINTESQWEQPVKALIQPLKSGEENKHLPLYVMKGNGPTLLGWEWLYFIQSNCPLMDLETQSLPRCDRQTCCGVL